MTSMRSIGRSHSKCLNWSRQAAVFLRRHSIAECGVEPALKAASHQGCQETTVSGVVGHIIRNSHTKASIFSPDGRPSEAETVVS